jgi:hypothetical protein
MNSVEFATKMGQGIYSLEFEKMDGSMRKMRATRMSAYIPGDKAPKSERTIDEATTTVPVFDLDLKEWRSIRTDYIKLMEFSQ